jgi:hypothetical protein
MGILTIYLETKGSAAMGNSAVITTEAKEIAVYLHWNGGRDSVEAFLEACHRIGLRAPEDDGYGWARMCQVIGNWIGGTESLGIYSYKHLKSANYDNGVYIIKNWTIIGREQFSGEEQNEYELEEFVNDILENQPKNV